MATQVNPELLAGLKTAAQWWAAAFEQTDIMLHVDVKDDCAYWGCYIVPEEFWLNAIPIPPKRRFGVVFAEDHTFYGFLLGAVQTKGWVLVPVKPQKQGQPFVWLEPVPLSPGDTLKLVQPTITRLRGYFAGIQPQSDVKEKPADWGVSKKRRNRRAKSWLLDSRENTDPDWG